MRGLRSGGIVSALLVGLALTASTAASSGASAPIGAGPGPVVPNHPPTPIGTATPSTPACQEWPALSAVAAAHGPLQACELLGAIWMAFTQGTPSEPGVTAEFACATAEGAVTVAACVDGSMADPPLSGWKVFAGPYPGGISPPMVLLPDGSVIVDDDGHHIPFDPTTGVFTRGP